MSPKPDQQLNFHGTVDVGVGVCEEGTGVGIHGEGAQVPIGEDMGVQVGVSGGTSREGCPWGVGMEGGVSVAPGMEGGMC